MKQITQQQMINYLQSKMDKFMKANSTNRDKEYIISLFDEMISCKEMVEALICEPVNLQKDGKVTVGL